VSSQHVRKVCHRECVGWRGVCGYASIACRLVLNLTIPGTVLWDGRFNEMTSSADLEKWSWANQVGNFQYYIHGSGMELTFGLRARLTLTWPLLL
jgi:hypothetical protein